MNLRRIFAAAAMLCVSAPVFAEGSSPWLPAPQSGYAEFEYLHQGADQLYVGSTLADLPGDLSQNAYFWSAEYGVTDKFSIDARIGYSSTKFDFSPTLPAGRNNGVTDGHFGFRYNLLDEFDRSPITLTFRAAGIIAGIYEPGNVESIGDGASGAEFGLLAGKIIGDKLSISVSATGRVRVENVPEEFEVSGTFGYPITDRIAIFGGIQYNNAFSRLDIGAPGFSFGRFPEVDEDYALWTAGSSFRLAKGFSLNGSYGRKFTGANTAKTNFFRISLGYAF